MSGRIIREEERERQMGTNDKKRLDWIKKIINDPPHYIVQRTKHKKELEKDEL